MLRKSTEPYKHGIKEAEKMCEAMERLNRMAIEEREEEMAFQLLKENMPIDAIVRVTGFSESRIRRLQEDLLVEA